MFVTRNILTLIGGCQSQSQSDQRGVWGEWGSLTLKLGFTLILGILF